MLQVVASLSAMFASVALLVAGSSLLGTLLALRLDAAGFSPLATGAVLVLHSMGFVVGTLLVTRLIQRIGQVRSFAAFAAIACAVALIFPMALNGWLWALLRGVLGFCYAGLIVVLESWISGRATNATRGTLLGLYQIVYFSAAACGQYLVGLAAPGDHPIFSLVAILIVLSLVPLAVTRSEAPVMGIAARLGFRRLWALSPSGLAGGAVAGIATTAFLTLAPLYGGAIGMSVDGVARYMTFTILAAMALQWPLGYLSDWMDRGQVLAGLAAVAGIAAVAAAAYGEHRAWLLFAATGLSFGVVTCLYPIGLALINDRMGEGGAMAASAGLLFAFGVGTCAGPLLAAGLMEILGPAGLFWFLGACLLALAVFVWLQSITTTAVPPAAQGRFVSVVAVESSPAMAELDPRGDAPK